MDIKEILVMHHSHLDIGYTHTQPVIEELQKDFIDQAFELFKRTAGYDEYSQPRWTCEATWQFAKWLERSSQEEIETFKKYVRQNRIGLGAIEMNMTPLCSAEEWISSLQNMKKIRSLTGYPLKVAFQHDVTGIAWPMSDLLLDCGVELLVMGINLHTSSDGPGDRPNCFRWKTPSGRELLVLNSHHYSMFDQICRVDQLSTEVMQKNLDAYFNEILAPRNYPYDFLFLTSTHFPVMYDNGSPNIFTAQLIKQWNEEGRNPKIRYVTPEMLLERLKKIPAAQLDCYRGDWTDFWNHGATSMAWETALNSRTKSKLKTSDMLRTINLPSKKSDLSEQIMENIKLYDEHTWINSASLDYHGDETRMQTCLKSARAIKGHELAGYDLINELEKTAENDTWFMNPDGMLLVNPSSRKAKRMYSLPQSWFRNPAIWGRVAMHRHNLRNSSDTNNSGTATQDKFFEIEIPPFSWQKIRFEEINFSEKIPELEIGTLEQEQMIRALDNDSAEKRLAGCRYLESPYYQLYYNPKNGRIEQLIDKSTGWEIIPPDADFDFFELIHEEPDHRFDSSRKSFYDRDVEKEKFFESCWTDKWRTLRQGISRLHSVEAVQEGASICLKRVFVLKGMDKVEHNIRLFRFRPYIEIQVDFYRHANTAPEAVYCVTQLNLDKDWKAHFDTAGVPVELDTDQLPGTSRGWVTSGSYAAMHSSDKCAAVFNAEAPLMQLGNFNFGRIDSQIERQSNPLLIAWPLDNYWETNFPAAQPGKISIRYGFQTYKQFQPEIVATDAEGFSSGVVIHPVAKCSSQPPAEVLTVSNPSIKVEYIRKSRTNENAVLIRLVNLSNQTVKTDFTWNLSEISKACLVNPLEEILEPVKLKSSNSVEFQLEPMKIITLKITTGEICND
jgi:hypothetical protein